MTRALFSLVALIALALTPLSCRQEGLRVGSKKFTESVILGEILTQVIQGHGTPAQHYQELGGTAVLFTALVNGEIDAYPDYTGTLQQEVLAQENLKSSEEIAESLAKRGLKMSAPLGFNNTYALAMLKPQAAELGITKISDLARHPNLRFGLSSAFMDRRDGWPALSEHYGFRFDNVRGMDHDIAYRQLTSEAIDVMDVYTTDAKIRTLDLAVLEDDREFFPRYDAVIVYRADVYKRCKKFESDLHRIEGRLDEAQMIGLNHQSEVDQIPEVNVAAEFVTKQLQLKAPETKAPTWWSRVAKHTVEHVDMVRKSLIPAILVGIPLGILAARFTGLGSLILNAVSIIQTIPALALLVLLIPVVHYFGGQSIGLSSLTAVVALFLYSLLPIVRGTHTGLTGIESQFEESAEAMGLSSGYRLTKIELPLASRNILSGIKTAAVMNVGFAALGGLIGAGGYGQPIMTGIRLLRTDLLLQGAIPAALLAILVQLMFDVLERWIVPKGLQTS